MTCATDLETSRCFQANLGRLSEEAQSRWRDWASRKCADFLLSPQEGGVWILHGRRDVESDAKTLQKLLRALGSHWKMKIQTERDWLRLLTPDAFLQVLGCAGKPVRQGALEQQTSEQVRGHARHRPPYAVPAHGAIVHPLCVSLA